MLVERAAGELPLRLQADLLSVSRSSLYYQPRPPSAEEVRLKHRIDEVYTQSPFYGSRKIAAQLQRDQMGLNRKTVARAGDGHCGHLSRAAVSRKRNRKEGVYPYATRATPAANTPIIFGE